MSILSRGVPVTEADVFEPHHYRHPVDPPICDAGHTHPALPAPPMDARIESIESGHDDVGEWVGSGRNQERAHPPPSTLRYTSRSILPPVRISPTLRPRIVSRSRISAASGAAPAPSAMLWVSE